MPIAASIRSGVRPQFNVGEIYMLNTWVILLFLNKIGFAANYDVSIVEQRVNKMKKKYLQCTYD